jgi:hypothetical protein
MDYCIGMCMVMAKSRSSREWDFHGWGKHHGLPFAFSANPSSRVRIMARHAASFRVIRCDTQNMMAGLCETGSNQSVLNDLLAALQ